MDFGRRLAEMCKARGFTQLELAEQANLSRRMLAYYEGQSEHPPTTHLPSIARALGVRTDELLGLVTVKAAARPKDTRLQRRMQEIEKLDVKQKRQIMQFRNRPSAVLSRRCWADGYVTTTPECPRQAKDRNCVGAIQPD